MTTPLTVEDAERAIAKQAKEAEEMWTRLEAIKARYDIEQSLPLEDFLELWRCAADDYDVDANARVQAFLTKGERW